MHDQAAPPGRGQGPSTHLVLLPDGADLLGEALVELVNKLVHDLLGDLHHAVEPVAVGPLEHSLLFLPAEELAHYALLLHERLLHLGLEPGHLLLELRGMGASGEGC
jgi:hypothetical protein